MNFYFFTIFSTFFPKAGANIKPFFVSNKTFLRFFLKPYFKLLASHFLSLYTVRTFCKNVAVFSGCKHTTLFPITKTFLHYFLQNY